MDLLTILRETRFRSYSFSSYNIGDGESGGYGNGNAWGNGYGAGNGSGNGEGNGNGYIYGDGWGWGDGNDNGNGDGSGYGYGTGFNYSWGIDEINGMEVYDIDGVPTAVEAVSGNYLKGYIICNNAVLTPCYVTIYGSSFAHGNTLKEAFRDAKAKEMENMPENERVSRFVMEHPDPGEILSNEELFYIHHTLTGSCELGRKEFCRKNNINLKGSMNITEFLTLTENEYGGDIIKKIKEEYLHRVEIDVPETPIFVS